MPPYPQSDWDNAKREARTLMVEAVRSPRGTITYGDLAAKIKSIKFQPDDQIFHALLGEISNEENDAQRGMLSVVVIRKGGDGRPGPGFFKFGKELGRDVREPDRFWAAEFELVRKSNRG